MLDGPARGLIALAIVCGLAAPVEARSVFRRNIEFTPVPLIGGDSDVGIGGGVLLSLARVSEIRRPYHWRLEALFVTTVRSIEGELVVPFQDYYVHLIVPHVVRDRLELQARISFTKMKLSYYGVGNAAPLPADPYASYFRYDRTHPTLRGRALYRLNRFTALEFGLAYTQNWLDVPRSSKLRDDAASDSETVRDLLDGFQDHAVFTNAYVLWFDTRDDRVTPRLGQLHSFGIDVSPGGTSPFPYRWTRVHGTASFYVPLHERIVLGSRLVLDALTGQAPFYELARYDDTFALGGAKGVRGVPGQRYHGELKTFGNLELRFALLNFAFLGKSNRLDAALFLDAGRLWATYSSNPELDGTGLGLKYGVGAGPRVLAGKSFVIRADIAWSPDARPIGAYFVAGDIF
jgi:outer membrane protein assembly factor BamA